jgi:sec-independent protein translocase protein TatB
MSFLGVGPAEVLVILVVALIFVGPERLPRLAADIARTIREIRRYTAGIAAEFTEVIEDLEKETADERGQLKDVGQGLTAATRSVTEALRGARADATGTPPAATAAPPPSPDSSPNGHEAAPATDAQGDAWVSIPEPPADGAAPKHEPTAPAEPR